MFPIRPIYIQPSSQDVASDQIVPTSRYCFDDESILDSVSPGNVDYKSRSYSRRVGDGVERRKGVSVAESIKIVVGGGTKGLVGELGGGSGELVSIRFSSSSKSVINSGMDDTKSRDGAIDSPVRGCGGVYQTEVDCALGRVGV